MAELRKFTYKGHEFGELKKMDLKTFMNVVPARVRRSLKRGFTEQQKIFLKNVKKAK